MEMKRLMSFIAVMILAGMAGISAQKLVVLHTNDTHSNILPDAKGVGGVLQRKAIIDSVRSVEKNVLLLEAGDMVQGTLFFNFFRGDVEYPLLNMMGYDVRILGNHEFDNGLEELAAHYRNVKGDRLSANYDFENTPLKGLFKPYTIKKVGGKKIGIIGINIDPHSLISQQNTVGMKYADAMETANKVAAELRHKKGCNVVIVVSHIGYSADVELARSSRDIDLIVGGHSHTTVDPSDSERTPSLIENLEGKKVRVVQVGKAGRYVGEVDIELSRLGKDIDGSRMGYKLIPVTDRFPEEKLDARMKAFIEPYNQKVDSVYKRVIAVSADDFSNSINGGGLPNFAGDFGLNYGRMIVDSLQTAGVDARVDFAIMNTGGIRQDMPKGDVTEGQILSMFPFSNRMVLINIKGKSILKAMEVAARRGGEAVSSNVRVIIDDERRVLNMLVDGREVDPEKTYGVMTIDYLAAGNDGMESLAENEEVWRGDIAMSGPMIDYVSRLGRIGLPINPDKSARFIKQVVIEK